MAPSSSSTHREGLKAARLLMVLSSISPLFILWAIRGNSLVPDHLLIGFCVLMVALPNTFLWLRIRTAKKQNDKRELTVGRADDHRDHILVYLFAMLLPFYSANLVTYRDLGATITALAFIVFLFWHLNLHYMNLIFAARGMRVFTIYPPADGNGLTGKTPYAVITRRVSLAPGERLVTYRLSDTVYLEDEE
jgi:cytochrome b561